MKKILVISTLISLFCLTPSPIADPSLTVDLVKAKNPIVMTKPSMDTYRKLHDKYAVVLSNGFSDFCSGTITKEGIVTAAHCCAAVRGGDFLYSVDGSKYKRIVNYKMDENGNDICIAKPNVYEPSPIKLGSFSLNVDYISISKISLLYGREDMLKDEVQNVFRITSLDVAPELSLFVGEGRPGMSGSAILNKEGNLVGVLVIGFFKDSRNRSDFVPHVFGAASIELSMWGDRTI